MSDSTSSDNKQKTQKEWGKKGSGVKARNFTLTKTPKTKQWKKSDQKPRH